MPHRTTAPNRPDSSTRRLLRTPLSLAIAATAMLVVGCSAAPKTSTAATTSAAAPTPTPTPTPMPAPAPRPAIRPAETFDVAWETVRDQHFDKTLNGVDWNAVREEFRPRAVDAASQDELRAVLLEMLSRLGQSHFTVIPSEVAERSPTVATAEEQIAAPTERPAAAEPATTEAPSGDAGGGSAPSASASDAGSAPAMTDGPGFSGIDLSLVDGEMVVLRVTPASPGASAGVLTGWTLVSVDGREIERALRPIREELAREQDAASPHARQLRTALAVSGAQFLEGNAGETRRALFKDGTGAEQAVTIRLEPAPYGTTKFGNLPALPVEVDSRIVELPIEGGKPARIGYLSFNIWMTGASPAIDRAIDTMRGCDGIVIDLRGNPGGVGAMSMGVAGHFLREPASLGSMIGRDNSLEFRASPRKVSTEGKRVRPYAKPLALIVDARSASTSEVFAGGLQDLGRARVFGETTAGMALPANALELPNGDVLLHAVADFVTSKGTRLEGRGVVPDEAVVPARDALLTGRDPAFDAASAWIVGATVAARAPKAPPAAAVEAVVAPTSVPAPAPAE